MIKVAVETAVGLRDHVAVFGTDYPTPDGTCIRDYIHVVDLAEAHIRALEALDAHELFAVNLGTGSGTSVLEVIESVRRVAGRALPVEYGPRRPGGADSAITYADPSLANELLHWRASRTLDDMVASAWAWRQRHPRGYDDGAQ